MDATARHLRSFSSSFFEPGEFAKNSLRTRI
jgi:hypothetical protein